MIISLINHTGGKHVDAEVQGVVRAINRQISQDFAPYWGMSAALRLEGKSGASPDVEAADMRGDAVIYLWDKTNEKDALGFHDRNNRGIPCGFVFTNLATKVGEPWSATLSHETLEMIADPEANLFVKGPHPAEPTRDVLHWYEMCDAVQAETYTIDGVSVSNFVLPLYFTGGEEVAGRNDFLGTRRRGKALTSFGVNSGGYVGFFDPQLGESTTFTRDRRGVRRLTLKMAAGRARRAVRYQGASAIQQAAVTRKSRRVK